MSKSTSVNESTPTDFFNFRPATPADVPVVTRRASKYDALLEALLDGPQVVTGIEDPGKFRGGLSNRAYQDGAKISMKTIDKGRGVYRVERK